MCTHIHMPYYISVYMYCMYVCISNVHTVCIYLYLCILLFDIYPSKLIDSLNFSVWQNNNSYNQSRLSAAESVNSTYSPIQQSKTDNANSAISLILILDIFFILNQLGYCILAFSRITITHCDSCGIKPSSINTIMFISDIIECLSHSLNFYFYVIFSRLVRQNFLEFVSDVRQLCTRG